MEKLGIECKNLMAKEVKEKLKDRDFLFVTSFQSMAVSEQEQLRRRLKEIDAAVFMAKNHILRETFEHLKLKDLTTLLQGPTAIAMGGRDYVLVSKALVDFAGKHENFKILGAYVDEQLLDLNSIKRLASIPSREVLLRQIVWGFIWPIQGLVNTLSATIRNLVVVIDRIREKK